EIHTFIDKLNYSIEHEYFIIKEKLYRDVWKIGFAFVNYTETSLDYILFPILYGQNSLQIRKLKSLDSISELDENAIEYYGHPFANLIKTNQTKLINWFVRDKLEHILVFEMLLIPSLVVAQEFLFSFMESYSLMLGLEVQSSYLISEIKKRFKVYLPLWLDEYFEASKEKVDYELNIDELFISDEERNDITTTLQNKLELSPTLNSSSNYILESTQHPLDHFYYYIDLLEKSEIAVVQNPYSPLEPITKTENWIWERYTPASFRYDVEVMYKSLPSIYDTMVSKYFPSLKDKLFFYKGFNKIVILLDAPSSEVTISSEPSMNMFLLKSIDGNNEGSIDVYVNTYFHELTPENMQALVNYNGKEYLLQGFRGSSRYNFSSMPLHDLVYKTLKNDVLKL
ncbi:MAG: hypothetical protein O9353_11640, partial [Bacteroidia bacterium]|nr:hypothetical protein [Bacteroidia bacterium]